MPRLRALAHEKAGDYHAALIVEREVVRLATNELTGLWDRITQAARTQLDHEALRRLVAQYASQALTDPLTGIPNRRHFESQVQHLADTTRGVTVGVIDLDGFNAVNSAHGHLGGDLVLQRVAAILARTVRQCDFIARSTAVTSSSWYCPTPTLRAPRTSMSACSVRSQTALGTRWYRRLRFR